MNEAGTPEYAVLTGARGDIGAAIGLQLKSKGLVPIEVDCRTADDTDAEAIRYTVDLSDHSATQACALEVAQRFSPLTFVHCAGRTYEASLEELRAEDVDAAWQLFGGAAICILQALLPAMKAARYGRVVLIGSRAMLGLPRRTTYSAMKSAFSGLARTWALELSPHGVTVNLVSPGPIATSMLRASVPPGSDIEESIHSQIPLMRLGTPEDVARAVTFFTDRACDWITGQNLYVCGGTSISGVHAKP